MVAAAAGPIAQPVAETANACFDSCTCRGSRRSGRSGRGGTCRAGVNRDGINGNITPPVSTCDGIEAQGLESWRHRQGHREPLVTAVTCYTPNVLPTAGAILRFEMQPTHAQAEHVIHEADVEGGSTGHRIWRVFQNEEISRQGWLAGFHIDVLGPVEGSAGTGARAAGTLRVLHPCCWGHILPSAKATLKITAIGGV